MLGCEILFRHTYMKIIKTVYNHKATASDSHLKITKNYKLNQSIAAANNSKMPKVDQPNLSKWCTDNIQWLHSAKVIWQVHRTQLFPCFLLTGHLTPSASSFYSFSLPFHGVRNQIVRMVADSDPGASCLK